MIFCVCMYKVLLPHNSLTKKVVLAKKKLRFSIWPHDDWYAEPDIFLNNELKNVSIILLPTRSTLHFLNSAKKDEAGKLRFLVCWNLSTLSFLFGSLIKKIYNWASERQTVKQKGRHFSFENWLRHLFFPIHIPAPSLNWPPSVKVKRFSFKERYLVDTPKFIMVHWKRFSPNRLSLNSYFKIQKTKKLVNNGLTLRKENRVFFL